MYNLADAVDYLHAVSGCLGYHHGRALLRTSPHVWRWPAVVQTVITRKGDMCVKTLTCMAERVACSERMCLGCSVVRLRLGRCGGDKAVILDRK
jgi:hypothetical protein